jgi:hypothetical protein
LIEECKNTEKNRFDVNNIKLNEKPIIRRRGEGEAGKEEFFGGTRIKKSFFFLVGPKKIFLATGLPDGIFSNQKYKFG